MPLDDRTDPCIILDLFTLLKRRRTPTQNFPRLCFNPFCPGEPGPGRRKAMRGGPRGSAARRGEARPEHTPRCAANPLSLYPARLTRGQRSTRNGTAPATPSTPRVRLEAPSARSRMCGPRSRTCAGGASLGPRARACAQQEQERGG